MQYKDDPEKWTDLKRKQTEYEHRRNQLVSFYESVKSAQQVTVDEIPLPQLPQQMPSSAPSQIPLPVERKPEHTIYSIATALKLQALVGFVLKISFHYFVINFLGSAHKRAAGLPSWPTTRSKQ